MSSPRTTNSYGPIHTVITTTSFVIASISLTLLTLVMVVEAVARYTLGAPLGWNISLIEKILLPAIVFLGLPWARSVGAHVSAGMIFERLPRGAQRVGSWIALALEAICYVLLLISGLMIAITMFRIGAQPPPLSAQIGVPTWTWRAFLPLGAAAALTVTLIEASAHSKVEENV